MYARVGRYEMVSLSSFGEAPLLGRHRLCEIIIYVICIIQPESYIIILEPFHKLGNDERICATMSHAKNPVGALAHKIADMWVMHYFRQQCELPDGQVAFLIGCNNPSIAVVRIVNVILCFELVQRLWPRGNSVRRRNPIIVDCSNRKVDYDRDGRFLCLLCSFSFSCYYITGKNDKKSIDLQYARNRLIQFVLCILYACAHTFMMYLLRACAMGHR